MALSSFSTARRPRPFCALLMLSAGLTASAASAEASAQPHAYGILVGSNAGGPGQTELRYAEEDAKKMGQVLRELGRYGTTDMNILLRPSSADVLGAVDAVGTKLRAHQAKGEQAVLVFYYSGHAKANAFTLGNDELPIAALRDKLRQLPTTLTLVVLDACQSGQFARTKGAEPAADFSFNSVSRLTTKGTAVLASSTAQELSQESDHLRSSYFTHHLIVGLRGAGDIDNDGRVSLDEAYRYAYRRTLAATARTAVGGQHVTLETDLSGQGDVIVTYPANAGAQLELPDALEGRVLVQHKPSDAIVAEVQKVAGRVKLALPAGSYEAVVRRSKADVLKCAVTLSDARPVVLDLGTGCQSVGTTTGLAKGLAEDDDEPPRDVAEPVIAAAPLSPYAWQLEAGFGYLGRQVDAYTDRLGEFGYRSDNPTVPSISRWRLHLGASKGILPHLAVGAYVHTLIGDRYERRVSGNVDALAWNSYAASAFVRASTVFAGSHRKGASFAEVYGQAALGLSMGITTLTTAPDAAEHTDTHWGWVGGVHGGVGVGHSPVVVFLQGGYEYAPTLANLLGETHNVGGPSGLIGLRYRLD